MKKLIFIALLFVGCNTVESEIELNNEITINDVHVEYIKSDTVRITVFDDYILPDSIASTGYYWSLTISDFEYYRSLDINRGHYSYDDYTRWYVDIPCKDAFDETIYFKVWTDSDTLRAETKKAPGVINFLNRTC